MTYFLVQDRIVNTVPDIDPKAPVEYEENLLKDFLDSLAPSQMSALILSGAFDKAFSLAPAGEAIQRRAFPCESLRRGFSYEEWKNRSSPKIR